MLRRILVVSAILCASCVDSGGLDGRDAIVDVADEPESSACPFGGVKIESGLDEDGDGELARTEVDDTRYVCNGTDAKPPTRTRVSEEPAGDNCSAGGMRIETGLDNDRDGELGDAEVQSTEFVCNGTDGENGEDGQDGTDGTNGTDGEDGVSYLTSVTAEPANGNCGAESGVRVDAGPDTNANGTLDGSEISSTEYVCDGEDGASGGTSVVSQYDDTKAISDGSVVTLVSASITASGPGTVVAIGSTDAFCTADGPSDHDCDTGGMTPGFVRIVDTANGAVNTGDGHGYFWLADDTTEAVQRSRVFTVSGAGTRTFYLRGQAQLGEMGFWRNQLTLVFLAD
jgi:hypothetical protein